MFGIDGIRWGYIFMKADSRLTDEERYELVYEAAEMFFNGERERFVTGEEYAGSLKTEDKYERLDMCFGKRFDAELYLNGRGESKLTFLINEQTPGAKGSPSMN
jgi:hypothetical protein